MGSILRRIIKYGIRKARNSSLIKSVLEEAAPKKSYKVFGRFSDSRGNTFKLLEGLRDELKPGWQAMLKPGGGFKLPSRKEVRGTVVTARASVERMLRLLAKYSFDLGGKKVLEIGCYDGARTFALAERGASEVTGSDIASYYVQQSTGVEAPEQDRHLASLRETVRKAAFVGHPGMASVRFVEDDICSSSLPSESFDLVCSWEVLEHVQEPQSLFQQIHRIMKPGGIAFHEYNPFFSLTGGHSLCTLDFHWGHARIGPEDFLKYLREIRPQEAEIAKRFYQHNLNRMTLSELETHSREAGFEIPALIRWSEKKHLALADRDILRQSAGVFPSVTLLDLITPRVWLLQRKS